MAYTPHKGKFKVTQPQKATHDGLDIVGLTSKKVYSTVNGQVEIAGWESANDHSKGFGLYIRIRKSGTADRYYFGHLKSISVRAGQIVRIGQEIGVEGSTGKSTGSHVHYCCRANCSKYQVKDISVISGIPNKIGTYMFDGRDVKKVSSTAAEPKAETGVTTLKKGSWNVRTGASFSASVDRVVQGPQSVTYVDIVDGDGIKWYKLRDGCFLSVNACE